MYNFSSRVSVLRWHAFKIKMNTKTQRHEERLRYFIFIPEGIVTQLLITSGGFINVFEREIAS